MNSATTDNNNNNMPTCRQNAELASRSFSFSFSDFTDFIINMTGDWYFVFLEKSSGPYYTKNNFAKMIFFWVHLRPILYKKKEKNSFERKVVFPDETVLVSGRVGARPRAKTRQIR